nr:ATP-binding protein [Streptomyces flaveolus]
MLPARPRPTKGQDLATLSCVEGKANAALFGPPRVGKTHIAAALAVAACRSGYPICFTSLDDMVRFAGRDLAWIYFRTNRHKGAFTMPPSSAPIPPARPACCAPCSS